MANGDDGFSEVGGGGSVVWQVEVKNGNMVRTNLRKKTEKVPWGYVAFDHDDVDGKPLSGRYFHVQILQPKDGEKVLVGYDANTGSFNLYVPIDDSEHAPQNPRQIRVMWAVKEEDVKELEKRRAVTDLKSQVLAAY
jgi:hypothetical protein